MSGNSHHMLVGAGLNHLEMHLKRQTRAAKSLNQNKF